MCTGLKFFKTPMVSEGKLLLKDFVVDEDGRETHGCSLYSHLQVSPTHCCSPSILPISLDFSSFKLNIIRPLDNVQRILILRPLQTQGFSNFGIWTIDYAI